MSYYNTVKAEICKPV